MNFNKVNIAKPEVISRPQLIQKPQKYLLKAATQEVPIRQKSEAANRKRLGDSDLIISECCLGTMTWGKQNTEREAHEQLQMTVKDYDINFIDTAENYPIPPSKEDYGKTHQIIGTWLRQQRREDIVLATKLCGRGTRNAYQRAELGETETRVNRKQIKYSVERSLKQINTDYIDLIQIHWPERYVPLFGGSSYDPKNEYQDVEPFENQLRAFEELVQEGKVRYLGVSNETSFGISEFSHAAERWGLPKIVSTQNVYNMLCRIEFETNMAETCRYKNVGLLAYSPLAGGSLSGKYFNDGGLNKSSDPNARMNQFKGYMKRYLQPTVQNAVAEYQMVAQKYNMTIAELAVAWCKSRWFVASTIVGATKMHQLESNIQAFNKELPAEAVDEINQIFKRYRDPTTGV